MNHTNQEVAQSYKAPSNHKMLFTNLGIGFGTFCILACIIKIYKVCYIKQRKNQPKEPKIPKDVSKSELKLIKTKHIPKISEDYKKYTHPPIVFLKNPLNKSNDDWEIV